MSSQPPDKPKAAPIGCGHYPNGGTCIDCYAALEEKHRRISLEFGKKMLDYERQKAALEEKLRVAEAERDAVMHHNCLEPIEREAKMSNLPRCPNYVAHPQAVWFEIHWLPRYAALEARCQKLEATLKAIQQHAHHPSYDNNWASYTLELVHKALAQDEGSE